MFVMENNPTINVSTEEKIKVAARKLFHKKGFAATRTRDIADEAGINLALLNYYFRSKKKLFTIIMHESLKGFISSITGVINNPETSLREKIEIIVDNYIDLFSTQPDIPLFVLSELRSNPEGFVSKLGLEKVFINCELNKQICMHSKKGGGTEVNPLHVLMNTMGMTIFPFIAKPLISGIGDLDEEGFNKIMQERKKLIPVWTEAILATM